MLKRDPIIISNNSSSDHFTKSTVERETMNKNVGPGEKETIVTFLVSFRRGPHTT